MNGVVTRPPLERCKLTLVLRLMKFSVTSPNAGRQHRRNTSTLSRMELAILQFGRHLRLRAFWERRLCRRAADLVTETQQVRAIPKGQRFAGRPTLEKLFARWTSDKTPRDQLIENAVSDFGYSQMELGIFLNLHYSTISRILAATNWTPKVKT